MNLYHYFLSNNRERIIKDAHYFVIYERFFNRYVNRPVLFFEIGTGDGGSAQMWKHYFGPMARIVTIDIVPKEIPSSQIYVRTGDQSNPAFLRGLVEEFGKPDIVLDDGSHIMAHINASFDHLYSSLADDGIYVVEDLDTAYWHTHGGGFRSPTSFIERAKDLIDVLNARNSAGSVQVSDFSKTTLSISFFDKVIVFEKCPYLNTELLHLPTKSSEVKD